MENTKTQFLIKHNCAGVGFTLNEYLISNCLLKIEIIIKSNQIMIGRQTTNKSKSTFKKSLIGDFFLIKCVRTS